ncbi:hypothetical protein [Methylobacterium durans]|uniref:Uncharacterized protein n=1 Tax=Methylobacterium durans TaxID=2202825 RepID=A0A2U8W9Z8_9HYPH|nr:hypothetical protein [Methylobacterium durans]AWN42964.1 hypothetical protein DK389_23780 [Methylobacterium durans]
MPFWIPALSLCGLVCLMIIPAPGYWGVLIGGLCLLIILVWAVLALLDRVLEPLRRRLAFWRETRARKRRRAVHSGSGIARKV